MAQPNIAAYESGQRTPSAAMLKRLRTAAKPRPSVVLAKHRRAIIALARQHKASHVRVFGSAARGQDVSGSEIDLLVRFAPDADVFDLAGRLVAQGKSVYDSDEAVRLAAEAILHKIGEGVARLPDEFAAAHPDVAWRSMKATRNIVAHEYEQVDYELIWNALAYRLPAQADRIRQILRGRASQRGSDG